MKNSDKNAILVLAAKNVKMQDAGEKDKNYNTCTPRKCVDSSSKNDVHYPTMWLNTNQVPALKGLEVENEVILVVKGKITGHSLNENSENHRESYDISIKEIGILDKKEVEEDD